jgi:hypothetical protein
MRPPGRSPASARMLGCVHVDVRPSENVRVTTLATTTKKKFNFFLNSFFFFSHRHGCSPASARTAEGGEGEGGGRGGREGGRGEGREVRPHGRPMSAQTQKCVRVDAPQCPRGRIFTTSTDGKTYPRVKQRPQGKRGRGRTSGW